jgi:hypothetical protein
MSRIDNTPGNILIRHNDKWRGTYYLRYDLTFTTDRDLAGRFYLLKPGVTTILNGDRISINSGNRTLAISNNVVSLIDRTNITSEINEFIVTNRTNNTDPITYESPLFFITDKDRKMALKYSWKTEFIERGNGLSEAIIPSHPDLITSYYGETCETHVDVFQFYLERADSPIINLNSHRNTMTQTYPMKSTTKTISEYLDTYRGAVIIILLMIVLVLCVLASK